MQVRMSSHLTHLCLSGVLYALLLSNTCSHFWCALVNKVLAAQKAGCHLIRKVPLMWKPEGPWTLAFGSADTPYFNLLIKWTSIFQSLIKRRNLQISFSMWSWITVHNLTPQSAMIHQGLSSDRDRDTSQNMIMSYKFWHRFGCLTV